MSLANFDFSAAEKPLSSKQFANLWRPYIEPCIEHFGVERCMVSSNFPVEKAGVPYGILWNTFKHIAASLSVSEKNMLFSGTAKQVYRIT